MVENSKEKFQKEAKEVASSLKPLLNKKDTVKIRTHDDPDGITAGSIFAKFLTYYDIPFHIIFESQPNEEDLKKLSEQDYGVYVFLDQGSDQFTHIENYLLENGDNVIIFDHHPGDVSKHPKLDYLNPHQFGLSGSSDVSAAGVTYLVVEKIDEEFEKLSTLALIGATGDRQNLPNGFKGLNKFILDKSIDNGFLEKKEGLKIGLRDDSVMKCLKNSVRPYIAGLSGEPKKIEDFLKRLGIDPDDRLGELGSDKEEKLRDELIEITEVDSKDIIKNSIWGTILESKISDQIFPKNIHEVVLLLDACEKYDKQGVGFSMLLGDEESKGIAREELSNYQDEMIESVSWISENRNRIEATDEIKYIDLTKRDGKFRSLGEFLSIIIESGIVEMDKPLLGLAKTEDGRLKVSARGTDELVNRGVDLGEILNYACEELDGNGGGHDVAAGARLSIERKDEFLSKVKKLVTESMN